MSHTYLRHYPRPTTVVASISWDFKQITITASLLCCFLILVPPFVCVRLSLCVAVPQDYGPS